MGIRQGSRFGDADFVDNYSYHGLIVEDTGNWQNLFGGALTNGAGDMFLALDGFAAVNMTFDVLSNGAVAFDSESVARGSLVEDGTILFRSLAAKARFRRRPNARL